MTDSILFDVTDGLAHITLVNPHYALTKGELLGLAMPSPGPALLELAAATDVIAMLDDDEVQIGLEGPATLVGFGSAAPATEESFIDDTHRTYRGRALAVVRAGTIAGAVRVTAQSARHGAQSVDLTLVPAAEPLYGPAAGGEPPPCR